MAVQGRDVGADGHAQRAFAFGQRSIAAGIRLAGSRGISLIRVARRRFCRSQIRLFTLTAGQSAQAQHEDEQES